MSSTFKRIDPSKPIDEAAVAARVREEARQRNAGKAGQESAANADWDKREAANAPNDWFEQLRQGDRERSARPREGGR